MNSAVPQRASKVARSLEMLRGQEEFRLGALDEATVLDCQWTIEFQSPANSPYHPQLMEVGVTFPPRFPFEPPSVCFKTRVYHPNIDTNGTICLDLLKPLPSGSWKPSIDIITLLTAVKLLLAEPNPDDPLMPEIASDFRERRVEYERKARIVAETGVEPSLDCCEDESVAERKETRSLLKKRKNTTTESVNEPIEAKVEACTLDVPLTAITVAEPEEQKEYTPTASMSDASSYDVVVIDDDDFETPVRVKKASLLTSKRSKPSS